MSDKNKLFNLSELKSPSERLNLLSKVTGSAAQPSRNYSGKAAAFLKELDQLLLTESTHIDFMTAGTLSLHMIIEHILFKYGKCLELYISTWAIKEAAARSLLALKNADKIGSLYGIFDYRVKTVDSLSFRLVQNIFHRCELTKNHSKVVLLEYKDRYITILCSANLSNNPRIEAGFISMSKNTFLFHKEWMLKVFDGKKVY